MEIKKFLVRGKIVKNPREPMRFKKVVKAAKKEHAIEKIYSLMGSRHRAKRRNIIIEEVVEVEES